MFAAISADHLHQIGQLTLLLGTGVLGSIVHSFIKRDGWSDSFNNGLALGYSFVIALLDLWLKGQIHLDGDLFQGFLVVYGAAQAWYAVIFLLTKAENSKSTPDSLPVVTQA